MTYSDSTMDQSMFTTTISQLTNCQSSRASRLCIFDLPAKLMKSDTYDIGGSYTGDEPDLWFFYTTSSLSGLTNLLNLFVVHRKTGNVSIGISDSDKMCNNNENNSKDWSVRKLLSNTLKWQSFKSLQPDQVYYITTYNFTKEDVLCMRKEPFFIPISIDMNMENVLSGALINSIKLNHDFSKGFTEETTDFVLKSASGKEYKIHKLFILAHCPILRKLILKNTTNTEFIDIKDSDMKLLIEFIYTGAIKDLERQDCMTLLDIAARFQMKNLFNLTELVLSTQINKMNAVEIAILSKKYNLEKLQQSAFEFIADNPEVLETEGWTKLNDINLAKKLLEFIHKSKSRIYVF